MDYGLAYRYMVDGEHKQYKADPKKAHNGTIEYTSTDAHDGACEELVTITIFYLALHLCCGKMNTVAYRTTYVLVLETRKYNVEPLQ